MLRALTLAAIGLGAGIFAASLLRSERRELGGGGAEPVAPGSCTARTRSGAPCSRPAEPGADRCWQHR